MAGIAKSTRKKKVKQAIECNAELLGQVITDSLKQKWRIGEAIGTGGFGAVYSCQNTSSTKSEFPYVIKLEPSGNGPLFVEMHFFLRFCRDKDIEDFKKKKALDHLGIPSYISSGIYPFGNTEYRFLIMPRFGRDVHKLWKEGNNVFSTTFVFSLALQMVNAVEYIHERGYIHGDIKGANIIGEVSSANEQNFYLVDFGMASKFVSDSTFKPDPKQAHNGTIEYISRDMHEGVPTRRSDLEILGYNMIHWLGGHLPWEAHLKQPKLVHSGKIAFMKDIRASCSKAIDNSASVEYLISYLEYVNALKFNTKPDYAKIEDMLKSVIIDCQSKANPKINSSVNKQTKTTTKRKIPNGTTEHPPVKKVDVVAMNAAHYRPNAYILDDVNGDTNGSSNKSTTKKTKAGTTRSKRLASNSSQSVSSRSNEVENSPANVILKRTRQRPI